MFDTLNIDDFIITQHELRYHKQLDNMIYYVSQGGNWTEKYLKEYAETNKLRVSPLINISKFEDNLLYIHDGHHRTVATLLGGRKYLYPDEYVITHWTYAQYMSINLKVGWVTPFDPRTHVRKADLKEYKNKIKNSKDPVNTILASIGDYLIQREMKTVAELANQYDYSKWAELAKRSRIERATD